jgi:tungstate transport system ATP-binding protein
MREADLSTFAAAEGATPAPRPAPDAILPLRAEGLVLAAGGRKLVDVDRLALGAGGVTAVMGPNGAGKSLLLRLLHGLIAPTAGRVTWNGAPAGAAVRQRQAMVFQRPVLLRRSVAANIAYALRARGVPRPERHARVADALDQGGLSALARQPARTLSGGEQQRLALVRALAVNPDILFLDEPASSLDPASTLAIERLVVRAARRGTKIVLVTHDLGQARRLADEVLFLHRGRVAEHRCATAFFDRPRSQAAREFVAGGLVL